MAEKKKTGSAGRIVVISGPSGSGKTTVCNRLLADPAISFSVSATTRPPRPGERAGVDYEFLSRAEFVRRAQAGCFAEHAEYNGNLYGTPRAPLEKALAEGRTVLVEIDVQGAEQLRRQYPGATCIFLEAPTPEVAVSRLDRRNTETPDERRRRLDAAERERAQRSLYDHVVINDDLEQTVRELRRILSDGGPRGGKG